MTETHIVEFWPSKVALVEAHELPQSTVCENEIEAISLELKFHSIGWPARAVTLRPSVQRVYLTSKKLDAA